MRSPLANTFSAYAVNLRQHALGEADRIMTLFCRDRGKIRAVAKGVRKTTSKLGGRMELLCVNRLEIRKGRSLDLITGCETAERFTGLRTDYDRLTASLMLAELLYRLLEDEQPHPELFDLFLATLRQMESTPRPLELAFWFQLRLLELLGYRLDLAKCHVCGANLGRGAAFDVGHGALLCGECRSGRKGWESLSADELILLQGYQQALSGAWPSGRTYRLQQILGQYLTVLAEREIKALALVLAPALDAG